MLAHGRWFSPGTPASSTTKTGHHDIAEILLKVALNTINQIKSTEEAMKNRLSRNSGNIGLKTRNEDKQYKKGTGYEYDGFLFS